MKTLICFESQEDLDEYLEPRLRDARKEGWNNAFYSLRLYQGLTPERLKEKLSDQVDVFNAIHNPDINSPEVIEHIIRVVLITHTLSYKTKKTKTSRKPKKGTK